MWPIRYWCNRFFASRYWPKGTSSALPDTSRISIVWTNLNFQRPSVNLEFAQPAVNVSFAQPGVNVLAETE